MIIVDDYFANINNYITDSEKEIEDLKSGAQTEYPPWLSRQEAIVDAQKVLANLRRDKEKFGL